jgi:poly-gamma-glutamate synthesis protein (capsule biosynthesis protein)
MTSPRLIAIAALAAACVPVCACTSSDNEITGDGAATATAPIAPSPTAPAPTIEPITTLIFTGDIIPARCSLAAMRASGGANSTFAPLRDILTSADITVGVLDSTISTVAQPYGCTSTFNLAGEAAFADALVFGGFDVISHAANHTKDCGAIACGDAAMNETRLLLEAKGIAVTGSGADLARARAPAIVERNGVRFAFLAYDDIAGYYHAGPGYGGSAPLDATTVGDDIRAARAVADVVIVLPHWGVEYVAEPNERQREFAMAAAAAGASLVVGNHPHWVQGNETIGEVFVAYSLGNFVFDQDWSLETQQGALLSVTFTGTRMTSHAYTPVRIYDEYQPRLAPPAEARQIIERIESGSP